MTEERCGGLWLATWLTVATLQGVFADFLLYSWQTAWHKNYLGAIKVEKAPFIFFPKFNKIWFDVLFCKHRHKSHLGPFQSFLSLYLLFTIWCHLALWKDLEWPGTQEEVRCSSLVAISLTVRPSSLLHFTVISSWACLSRPRVGAARHPPVPLYSLGHTHTEQHRKHNVEFNL